MPRQQGEKRSGRKLDISKSNSLMERSTAGKVFPSSCQLLSAGAVATDMFVRYYKIGVPLQNVPQFAILCSFSKAHGPMMALSC